MHNYEHNMISTQYIYTLTQKMDSWLKCNKIVKLKVFKSLSVPWKIHKCEIYHKILVMKMKRILLLIYFLFSDKSSSRSQEVNAKESDANHLSFLYSTTHEQPSCEPVCSSISMHKNWYSCSKHDMEQRVVRRTHGSSKTKLT